MSDMPDTTERRAVRSWFEMFCDLSEKYQALVAQQDEYRVPKSVFQAVRDDRNRLADELQALKPGAATLLQVCSERDVLRKERDELRDDLRDAEEVANRHLAELTERHKRIEELSSLVDAQELSIKRWEESATYNMRSRMIFRRRLAEVMETLAVDAPSADCKAAMDAARVVLADGPEADPMWPESDRPIAASVNARKKLLAMSPEELRAAINRIETFCEEDSDGQ